MSRRLLWLPLCLVLFGCGRDVHPKQLDEPCTRTEQCADGLACLVGVCLPAPVPDPDAGVDGGADAGS
jgi:hypothetical protein